jgi:filamentous hemagglutinin family protein
MGRLAYRNSDVPRTTGGHRALDRVLDLLLLAGAFAELQAQVVMDGSVGPKGSLAGPQYQIVSGLGSQIGPNLFHSFSQFDLKAKEAAQFSGPSSVHNVFARVTGGSASSINGKIECTIAGADFYLLNPAGIVLGPGATINVDGAFTVSTADYIRLEDNGQINARRPAQSVLTAAPVEAFGFLGPTQGKIEIDKSVLKVKPEQSLSLIGGDISMNFAALDASAGRIAIRSINGAGEVSKSLSASTVPVKGGNVDIGSFSTIRANGTPDLKEGRSGDISIRGGHITISGDTRVAAQTYGSAAGGGIELAADTKLAVLDSVIITTVSGNGKAGSVSLQAPEITLDGRNSYTFISTDASDSRARGTGGDIWMNSKDLILYDALALSTSTGLGNSGNINITSENSVKIVGSGTTFLNGLDADAEFTESLKGGSAGRISIKTGTLEVRDGGSITANSFGRGASAGSVAIEANDVLIDGAGVKSQISTGIAAQNSGPNAGSISIHARSVELLAGGSINTSTLGPGKSGDIEISGLGSAKADRVRIDDHGGNQSTGIGAEATVGSTGNGGNIIVRTKSLEITGGGGQTSVIGSNTFGAGNAGDVDVDADVIQIHGLGEPVSPRSRLSLGLAGQIASGSSTPGAGGTVRVNARQITLDKGGSINTISTRTGDSGPIFVTATESLVLKEGSRISANSLHAGAEPVSIRAGNRIELHDSQISAQAALDGGLVDISAHLLYLDNSRVNSRSVQNGGDVSVSTTLLALNRGQIDASAVNVNGGNVTLNSAFFIPSIESSVRATGGPFGVAGEISLLGPVIDFTGTLASLPDRLLLNEPRLPADCAMKLGPDLSSLLVLGAGGLAIEPIGLLPEYTLQSPQKGNQ